MIVSAPASAVLHVPVVSLVPSPGSKDSSASKTAAFKNVFDSLTHSEDLPQEGSAGQEGPSVPKSPTKKRLGADASSGNEVAVVPQTASLTPPNPSFILQQLTIPTQSDVVVPEHAAADNSAGPELVPLGDPTDVASLLTSSVTTSSQTTPSSQQATLAPSAYIILALAASGRSTVLPSPMVPVAVGPGVATAISTAPLAKATSTKAAETKLAGMAPIETQPSVGAEAVQMPVPSASQPTGGPVGIQVGAPAQAAQPEATLPLTSLPVSGGGPAPAVAPVTILKPLVAKPVLPPQIPRTAQAPSLKPVQEGAIQEVGIQGQSAQPEATLPVGSVPMSGGGPAPVVQLSRNSHPNSLRTRTSAPVAQPSTNVASEQPVRANATTPPSDPVATEPASAKAPVNNRKAIEPSWPVSSASQAAPLPPQQAISGEGPAVAASAPQPMPEASSNSTPQLAAPSLPAEQSAPAGRVLEPTLAASAASPISLPEPLAAPAGREVLDRSSEALALISTPKIPLLPAAENFAFAVRMLGLESTSSHAPLVDSKTPVTTSQTSVAQMNGSVPQPQAPNLQEPAPSGNQTPNVPQRETQPSMPEPAKPDAAGQNQSDLPKAQQAPGGISHWSEAVTVLQAPEISSLAATPEPREAARPNLPLAAQETHLLAPEFPKTTASSEILLHLTGSDESSAAIRVADRAGSLNVSVHASDPVLRESLRSNLGELSTQLNAQGWKADVVKSAAVVTHSESQQDSHAGGQRGFQQQQSSGGERQPQRDRHAGGGQWQQELDQQITGGDARPGGNG